ncbi:MAG: prepilin-type N-terminal cleavage/methylation domain-containing protein [Planctomycetes bacterium]|nr:prepilin-type N-terminal cleavage/methylation domain-containing protein [Planctomycetota bacterium]
MLPADGRELTLRSARGGFTLLEMVVVLVLVGLMLAVSPMALDSVVSERELESEVSKLGTTIEFLQTQAVLDRTDYAIHYDTEKGRWAMQMPEEVEQSPRERGGKSFSALVLDPDVGLDELDWHALPAGISLELYEGVRRIDAGSYRVLLRANGTVDPHAVLLESNNISSLDEIDRIRTIKINFPGFVSYAPGKVLSDYKKSESELGR